MKTEWLVSLFCWVFHPILMWELRRYEKILKRRRER